MARIAFRFFAYLLAGVSFGGAGFLTLHPVAFFASQAPLFVISFAVFGAALTLYLLARASHVSGQGIRITPALSLAAMDLICVVASALTGFFIFEGYAAGLSGTPSPLGDRLVADVMLFMYFPAALVLAAFVSTIGAQRLRIDADGLFISGRNGGKAAWKDIKAIVPDRQYVVVSRIGVPMPRHLRTNMKVVFSDDEIIKVYEPGLKSTRREIVEKMRNYAPKALDEDIDEIAENWI